MSGLFLILTLFNNDLNMKKLILTGVLVPFITFLIGQNLSVQTLNYESLTRDTVIQFPDIDHNEYERILMHYSMRCKDALVSTGSNRNLGCGEWDYSCNTYIVDESRTDSLRQISPQFDFIGVGGESFDYTNVPTYTYFTRSETEIDVSTTITSRSYAVTQGSEILDSPFGQPNNQSTLQFVLTDEKLNDSGVRDNDKITGLELDIIGGEITLTNLTVLAQPTTNGEWSEDLINGDWELMANRTQTLNSTENLIQFFEKLDWDGMSNLAFQISYDNAIGSGIEMNGESLDYDGLYSKGSGTDRSWAFGTSGKIAVDWQTDAPLDEISISFWQYGYDNLPTGSSVLEGVDADGFRELNIHLPWGNSQVYWDCGNEGGYDRINKVADPSQYKNQWNHWAFTKNANTGLMRIYLNGEIFLEGFNKTRKIDVQSFYLGGNVGSLFSYGQLNEFRLFSKELSQSEIQNWMLKSIDDTHPQRDNLELYFTFDESATSVLADQSGNNHDGIIEGRLIDLPIPAQYSTATFTSKNVLPNMSIRQDLQALTSEEVLVIDSFPNLPQRIDEYEVIGTDLILKDTEYYYSANPSYIKDDAGNVVDSVVYTIDGTILANELVHYTKGPMHFEIMSFVTPYGIGLDFGEEGRTWVFDVTHLGPILKGEKRMYLARGGEWQEDMDIRFEYIEGIPDRDILEVQNIWPTGGRVSYQNIQNDVRFEPRSFTDALGAETYEVNMVVTGHGQEGEFIPRIHNLNISGDLNGNNLEFIDSWEVWKECAENPVFPQGGTWVYDRAGWCPGMASDVHTVDVTEYIKGFDATTLDYNIPNVSGASGYIVSGQLVSYGPINKENDLAVIDVVNPSTSIEHGKFNPACTPPIVRLKNRGSNPIRSAIIEYGIIGKSPRRYRWEGDLAFNQELNVELDFLSELTVATGGELFFARVLNVNDGPDEYANNDEYISEVRPVEHYENGIVIEFKTNNFPNETLYRVYDREGNQVLYRGGNLNANTTYRDTISNMDGCMTLLIEDADNDGLSWWANQQFDGNGYVSVKEIGGDFKSIATDFGAFIEYNFTLGMVSNTADLEIAEIEILPNPVVDILRVKNLLQWQGDLKVEVINQIGVPVITQSINKEALLRNGIDVSSINAQGVYYLSISDNRQKSIQKFIKMNP